MTTLKEILEKINDPTVCMAHCSVMRGEWHKDRGLPNIDTTSIDVMRYVEELEASDAAQRATIDDLQGQLKLAAALYHPTIDRQAKQIEQQAKEIERLKSDLSHWTFERYKQLEAQNHALREALSELYNYAHKMTPLDKFEDGVPPSLLMALLLLKNTKAALQEES